MQTDLYPSIYLDDDEAFDIWNKEIGIRVQNVFSVSEKRITSGSMAQVHAVHVLRSTMTVAKNTAVVNPDCTVGCDCDRYMEVWNNVFHTVRERWKRKLHRP